MNIGPRATAEFANAIAHALGLRDEKGPLSFEVPTTPRAFDALYTRLGKALEGRRPSPHAPSIGELVVDLASTLPPSSERRPWPPRRKGRVLRARRALAELIELVAQGSFERTKRAERGRIAAQLILLFDLEAALDLSFEPATDAEDALRRVRKALAGFK